MTRGTWTPTRYPDWQSWRMAFVRLVPDRSISDAEAFARCCEAGGWHPNEVTKAWIFWLGVPKRTFTPNWPADLTAADWASLRRFAENEAKAITKTEVTTDADS